MYHPTDAIQVPEVLEAIVFPQFPEDAFPDPVRLANLRQPLLGSAEAGLEEEVTQEAKIL